MVAELISLLTLLFLNEENEAVRKKKLAPWGNFNYDKDPVLSPSTRMGEIQGGPAGHPFIPRLTQLTDCLAVVSFPGEPRKPHLSLKSSLYAG